MPDLPSPAFLPDGQCIITRIEHSDHEPPRRVYLARIDEQVGFAWNREPQSAMAVEIKKSREIIKQYRELSGDWRNAVLILGHLPRNGHDVPSQDLDRAGVEWEEWHSQG